MLRHVNPDSHMDKCPVLTSESLGQHFYNNLGKYHKACRVRYSNSRATQLKTKISEDLSMKPASKAAKRERHVSAQCCINECRYLRCTDIFTGAGGGFTKTLPRVRPVA